MSTIYIKTVTRMWPVEVLREWIIGEQESLPFNNTMIIKDGDNATFYYDQYEIDIFETFLEENLTEDWFNELCDEFMELINKPNLKIREIVRHLTIFNEVDQYPEWFEKEYRESCMRRLMRVRESTHNKLYEMFEK
ncbi:MAG: hypothetical protein ACFFG0_10430 [Candidatus Thorarchaeota archaeon]